MKRMIKLLPAISGLLFNFISIALVIAAFVVEAKEVPPTTGISRSFALWVYSLLIAFVSIFLYFIDLYVSFRSLRPRFLIAKILLVFGAVPMVTLIGGKLGICILIWNLYFTFLLVIEIISFMKVIYRNSEEFESDVTDS